MKGFDRAWVEAAQDCGASEWQIFRRVILPNLRPGILVLLVLTVAEYWNIIDQAIIFIDDAVRQPLSVALSQMLSTENGSFFAASCLYVLPVLLVFIMGRMLLKKRNKRGAKEHSSPLTPPPISAILETYQKNV